MAKVCCLNPISSIGTDHFTDDYTMTSDLQEADAVLVRSAAMHDLDLPENLLAIARAGAGVNNIPLDKCSEKGIVVFNTPGANANGVKELVLAGLLLAARDIAGGIAWVKENEEDANISKDMEKSKKNFAGTEIKGKTLGVIGLGAIGRKVADIAKAFGCKVIYYSASGAPAQDGFMQVDFDTLLGTSDIVSIHAPLNEYTEGLMNEEAFQKMKSSAILINVGRGPIVNEKALADALNHGEISAAGLDVLSEEPMRADNPLKQVRDQEKLLITPHMAWATKEARTRVLTLMAGHIKDYFS